MRRHLTHAALALVAAAALSWASEVRAQPRVEPPVLQQFVEAPYPDSAARARREGVVLLQLDIDDRGAVVGVAVLSSAGADLDEAAVAAARRFVFAPARRDGNAVASRIPYRYTFSLGAREAPPEATVGELAGSVVASHAAAGVQAKVTVTAEGAAPREITTDAEGRFTLTGLPPGRYRVRVEATGYETVSAEEEVVEGHRTSVVYRPRPLASPTEVVVRGERPAREVTRSRLSQRELSRVPGTNGDALRAVQSLPGIARSPRGSANLIVRGSAPQDTQVFVDGLAIPIVYHFGGLSSVVPTEMLDRLDFYPGNFSAQFGRGMGGIVDLGLREGRRDGRYHGLAQIDLIDARAVLEGPVPLTKSWTFVVGGRRSHLDVWLKPVLKAASPNVTAAPVYDDYQLFAETRPRPSAVLRVGFLGSEDRLDAVVTNARANRPSSGGDVSLYTGFYRAIVSYHDQLSPQVRFRTINAVGRDIVAIGVGDRQIDVKTLSISHRSELSVRVGRGGLINVGQDIVYSPYEANLRIPAPRRAGEPSRGPFATRPMLTIEQEGSLYRPGAYAEAELTPTDAVRIVPGLRVDYTKDIESFDVSPRVSGKVQLHGGPFGTALKGGVGVFHQPPAAQDLIRLTAADGVTSSRALHHAVGVEQKLFGRVTLSVEGFYKQLDSLLVRSSVFRGFAYDNLGDGHVVGAETLVRYEPDARFFGWVAYTLSRAMRRSSPAFELSPFQYDQTHILTALGSYRLGGGWEFGARWRLVTGPLTTPCVGGLFDSAAGQYDCVSGAPFSERLSTFHQLDLRLDKRWHFASWQLSTYLDVYNAYNRQNAEGLSYNYNYSQSVPNVGVPIVPSLGVRGEF